MGQTPKFLLPYPEPTDPADVPLDMRELADRTEVVFGTRQIITKTLTDSLQLNNASYMFWPDATGIAITVPTWANRVLCVTNIGGVYASIAAASVFEWGFQIAGLTGSVNRHKFADLDERQDMMCVADLSVTSIRGQAVTINPRGRRLSGTGVLICDNGVLSHDIEFV